MRPDSSSRPITMQPAMITVNFDAVGFHRWSNATGERSYLANRHRHLFKLSVSVTVYHHDREVEFHDLLDQCRMWWPGPELGGQSCEDVARYYINTLADRYPGRTYKVSVFEDGEVGATLEGTDR